MALLSFRKRGAPQAEANMGALLDGFSIEVMPRTAAKIADFRAILPKGTRVYIAHIEGTPIEDMVATAARISGEGLAVMPHIPARLVKDKAMLADWIARYQGEADVSQALLLAGGTAQPVGAFSDSMQMLETGLFDAAGFTRLHVAGHPEGNRDIEPKSGDAAVMEALFWKQDFAERTDSDMALVTQFCFDAKPVIDWVDRLTVEGITLPVHIGVAGPAKLQTLIKFAVACGVGPSLKVLQKRAMDVRQLLMPYEPTEIVAALAAHKASNPGFGIEAVHFFPLGGINAAADWADMHGARPAAKATHV